MISTSGGNQFDFGGSAVVVLEDVTLDVGEAITGFLGPIIAPIKDIIGPGERVRASGHPSWNPETHGMQGAQVIKADGSVLGAPVEDGALS